MIYLAVDADGSETIFATHPIRMNGWWEAKYANSHFVELPKGTIERMTGSKLTWADEPIEL